MIYCVNNISKFQLDWFVKNYFTSTFTRIFVAIAVGIILAEFSSIPQSLFLWTALCGLTVMTISTFNKSNCWKWIFVISLDLFLSGTGGVLLKLNTVPTLSIDKNQTSIIQIISSPIKQNNYFRADARLLYTSDSLTEQQTYGRILCYIHVDSSANIPVVGDVYAIRNKIALKTKQNEDESFDYGRYLNRHGYSGMTYLFSNNIRLVKNETPHGFFHSINQFRHKLIGRYKHVGLEGNELSLITAVTLGEKGFLEKETKDNFSAAGVSHVLVVSGMHVGFIFAFILLLLHGFKRYKSIVILFGMLLLWGYALLTGFAPSVVRATFMFSIMLMFNIQGIKYRSYHALSLSAVILLIYNPYLLFDVGFQLSFAAVLSIIYFYPKMIAPFKRIRRYKFIYFIIQTITVSLSAQILTFPIVLYNFNQFPVYFMITNLIVSFIIPVIFCFGMFLLPLSFVPYVGGGCGWVINRILFFFNETIAGIANLPHSVTQGYISGTECILIYIVILFFANLTVKWKYLKYRFYAMVSLLGTIILLFSAILTNNIIDKRKEYCIIADSYRLNVNVFGNGTNVLFTNSTSIPTQFQRLWLKHQCSKPILITDTTLIDNAFSFDNKKYLILRDNIFRYKRNNGEPLQVDYLIIDKGVYPTERLLTEFIKPETVILTQAVWDGYLPIYKQLTRKLEIGYYSVSEQGTYIATH